jgi:hypothetical protein
VGVADVVTNVKQPLSIEGLKLWAAVEDHHETARSHLLERTGPEMAGVVSLDAHLAALDHTIHATAGRRLSLRSAIWDDETLTSELKRRLRVLERQLSSGETAPTKNAALASELIEILDAHARIELAIIRALDELLHDEPMRTLRVRYITAVQHLTGKPPAPRRSGRRILYLGLISDDRARRLDS